MTECQKELESNKKIAVQLFISESTVKKNITDLLVKLNLRDRVQLALYALAYGAGGAGGIESVNP